MAKQKKLCVKLIKSKYGRRPGHRECAEGLGLRRLHQVVEVIDTPANRGLIAKAAYLFLVEEV